MTYPPARIGRATIAAIGLALLLTVSLPIGGATPVGRSASTAPAAGANASWEYAGSRNISASGTTPNGTYTIVAAFGYDVAWNETPAPGNLLEVSTERTMGASYTLRFCAPSCGSPTYVATVRYHAAEVLAGHAILTTNATVEEGGRAVAALGIINESTSLSAQVTENDSVVHYGLLRTLTGTANLSLAVNATLEVALAPALGVVPLHLTNGSGWSSNAAFTASGTWSSHDAFARDPILGVANSGGTTLHFSVARSGNVSLAGSDLGNLTLRHGVRSTVVDLSLSGPLHFREGLLLIPGAADVFGAATVPNSPGGNGTLGEAAEAIDVAPSSTSGTSVIASSTQFSASAQDPGASTSGTDPALLTPASQSSGPVTVQAQPVNPGSVNSSCLLTGACLGTGGGPAGSTPRLLRPLVGVGLAALVVAAVVGTVVVSRRPKAPPRPNAALYPPVPAAAPARRPVAAPGTAPPGPSDEPDPLSHLW